MAFIKVNLHQRGVSNLDSTHYDGNRIIAVDHPVSGGNWTIYEVLMNGNVNQYDTGLAKPSTDGHYSLHFLLKGSDGKFYGGYSRWSTLHVVKFDPNNNWSGEDLGDVQNIPTDLNYVHFIPIRKDKWVVLARGCADGSAGKCTRVFRFNGTIDQVMDSALWEEVQTPLNSVGDNVAECCEGLPHIYARAYILDGTKVLVTNFQRCHSTDAGFAIFIYDWVRDKFYTWKGNEISGQYKYSEFPDYISVNTNGNLLQGWGSGNIYIHKNRYVFIPYSIVDSNCKLVSMNTLVVDLENKTTRTISDYQIHMCMDSDPIICLAKNANSYGLIVSVDINNMNVSEIDTYDPGYDYPGTYSAVFENDKLSYKYPNIMFGGDAIVFTDDTRCNIVDYSVQGGIGVVNVSATLANGVCGGSVVVKLIDSNGNVAKTSTINCSNGSCSGSIQANPGRYVVVIEQY